MKTAVIYYSKTGNTEGIAKEIAEKHHFDLHKITATSDDPMQKDVKLTSAPKTDAYERLIFAGPVHGFSIPAIMKSYLSQVGDLTGKTIDLFITHHFPFAWLGGNRTLRQMKRLILEKNGVVNQMTSVNWTSKKRQSVIINLINAYEADANDKKDA
ncbi:MAG: flavodoxin family protein [Acholeplasmataceae bacterium]